MYDTNLLNTLNLFQSVGGFLTTSSGQKLKSTINRLLHHGNALVFHLRRMNQLREEAIEQIEQIRPTVEFNGDSIIVFTPCVNEILFELSATFSSTRLLQDDLWKLIIRFYGVQQKAPHSLRDAIAKYRQRRTDITKHQWAESIPPELLEKIDSYWDQIGKRLRDFRDVDQHHDILSTHPYVSFLGDKIELSVIIPDNPENKLRRHFSFTERIDGLKFAEKSFWELHSLIEHFAHSQAGSKVPLANEAEIDPSIKIKENKKRNIAILLWDRQGSLGVVLSQSEDRSIYAQKVMSESRIKRESK